MTVSMQQNAFLCPTGVDLGSFVECRLPLYKALDTSEASGQYGSLCRCKYCPKSGKILEVSSISRPSNSKGQFIHKDASESKLGVLFDTEDLLVYTKLDPVVFAINYFLTRESAGPGSVTEFQDSFAWIETICGAYSRSYEQTDTALSLRKVFEIRGMDSVLAPVCDIKSCEGFSYYRFSRLKTAQYISRRVQVALDLCNITTPSAKRIFVCVALSYYHSTIHADICSTLSLNLDELVGLMGIAIHDGPESKNPKVDFRSSLAGPSDKKPIFSAK